MEGKMISCWSDTVSMPQFERLRQDEKTDVLIIGGGIAGLLTAYLLKQNGVPCLLLEQHRICQGITANTTAKLTVQHGLCYAKMLRQAGAAMTEGYLAANEAALAAYEKFCDGIDCDYQKKDHYVYSMQDLKCLESELDALQRLGTKAVFSATDELPFQTVGAVKFPDQAAFHPLKFLSAIAKDLNIREHTPVLRLEGTTAVTPYGTVRADRVIVATHFPFLNRHGSYFLKLYQHRSYLIALENAAKLDGMYLDEKQTGFTFRSHRDLLLIGGGAHRTGKEGGNWKELRSFVKLAYPNATERYFWAAQDCMSLDSRPYVGNYSRNTPHLFAATGFNKWGMTGAMAAAMLLSDRMVGNKNDYEAVFDPSRSILTPQLAVNGWESGVNLLRFGQKRCPHLGCTLRWNAAEHSWDCPCHGSRFDADGRCLDNPAMRDLRI